MRTPIIAGNWKMYKTPPEARALAKELVCTLGRGKPPCEVVVCPPAVSLAAVAGEIAATGIELGAQNCHHEPEGAFTGEVSAPMLRAAGVSRVIVGHSERRQYSGEDDRAVNLKVLACLAAGLKPIVCVGEVLAERDAGRAGERVRGQLEGALAGFPAPRLADLVIAYEPVWAIGTGRTATPDQAQEIHALIRDVLAGAHGSEAAGSVRIQYGGSVKPDNIAELMACPDIDGALVGGASLAAGSFAAIIAGACGSGS